MNPVGCNRDQLKDILVYCGLSFIKFPNERFSFFYVSNKVIEKDKNIPFLHPKGSREVADEAARQLYIRQQQEAKKRYQDKIGTYSDGTARTPASMGIVAGFIPRMGGKKKRHRRKKRKTRKKTRRRKRKRKTRRRRKSRKRRS